MKHLIYCLFALAYLISFSFINFEYSEEPCAYLDNKSGSWPKKYRTTKDVVLLENVETLGLNQLSESGSGQFTEEGLISVLKNIPYEKIIVIDLRQESHGFINSQPIMWLTNAQNDTNRGKSLDEIEQDEEQRLNEAYKNGTVLLYSEAGIEEIFIHSVNTERSLIESLGYDYVRLPVQDHYRPSDQVVDEFVQLVSSLPSDTWLYMHCRGGCGRTTTFMVMYDMIVNAQEVSFNDIIQRQYLLGGKNLLKLDPTSFKYEAAIDRLEFIKAFYDYCKEVPNFDVSWSSWIAKDPKRLSSNSLEF